ncbi:hypothetical protein BDQ17DRAFT_1359590 [Cyathus striatus]|nr:hypothetical protein BDQ17DRAFT_1359590 [Cyathus striatus]
MALQCPSPKVTIITLRVMLCCLLPISKQLVFTSPTCLIHALVRSTQLMIFKFPCTAMSSLFDVSAVSEFQLY